MATSNGGRTWQPRGPEQRFSYTKASHYDEANVGAVIADAKTGWLIGGHPEVTLDGGLTWSPIAVPAQLQQVHPVSGGAWAFAGQCPTLGRTPTLYREVGTRWSPSSAAPPGLQARGQIAAVSLSTAYVFSANPGPSNQTVLARTSDGGQHWQPLPAPCGTGWDELTALDAARLWLLCSDQPDTGEQPGVLYRSADGGQHWRLVAANSYPGGPPGRQSLSNFPYTGHDGDFIALPNGFLYISREKFGFVARSEDGGTNWTVLLADDGGGGYAIQILNTAVGWASNNGCLWRTINGGSHWSLMSTRPNDGCGNPLPQGAR
jgi:photosystem II stability/assembly factor-like uncharacterized protein